MKRFWVVFVPVVVLALSFGLAWISTGLASFQGWGSFFAVILLGAGILYVSWHLINNESPLPVWLIWLLIGTALLRLGAGVLWFTGLPQWGYGGEVEVSGYVMSDAHKRDIAAWKLAKSDQPLAAAFSEFRNADQYGGMLYGSALLYRFLGGETHQPLQMVVLTAAISALSVLFTWAFSRRLWDEKIAASAAWIVALFPDAVLLGSSQMREALMMTLAIMAFYGLVHTWQDRRWGAMIWVIIPILIAIPLSPLFALMLTGMLGVLPLFIGGSRWLKDWRVGAIVAGVVLLGLLVVAIFGEQLLPGKTSNPAALLQTWLRQAARWQAYNSEHASGWMQKIFRSTPDWSHTWLLLTYGVARPFLPAALFDPGASIWQAIAIWRALGWALLLPFLILALIFAWLRGRWKNPAMGLSILAWFSILVASFRGGGDAWDNPRYRTTWIGLYAALAAWVWVTQRQDNSPWLRRVLVGMGFIFLWFAPWYLDRMTAFEWPIKDVFLTLGCGILSVLLYWGWDILRSRKRQNST